MPGVTEVCVIGAGFHGLIAARRFLELYPNTQLIIFEEDTCLGGVWNRDRVYDELRTESSLGMYEYSDKPMSGDRIDGKQISLYLEDHAREYNLYSRIRFRTRVKNFYKSKVTGRWQLELEHSDQIIACDKLIIATGLTSTPSVPAVPSTENFSAAQYHVRSLSKIKIQSREQQVIVIGGAKSAYDAAYTMVRQGARRVTLVVKEDGSGPAWLIPECLFGHISTDKVIGTRLATTFNPNIWSSDTYLHCLFHKTTIGQWIVKKIWQIAEECIKWQIDYKSNSNLKKLLPPNGSLLWSSSNTCTLNHRDFLEMIKQERIVVKRSTVVKLVGTKTVCFADGTELETDLLIWATGWKSTSFTSILQTGIKYTELAEAHVLKRCPMLQQKWTSKSASTFLLYRRLVPFDYVDDHSIVYVGMLQSPGTGVIAEVQAVWCAVYLMKHLQITEDIEWEIAVLNVWLRNRYSIVERQSNYTHDYIRYADLLLQDLGLKSMRKKRWWQEIFEPYMPRDYKGLVAEWRTAQEKSK